MTNEKATRRYLGFIIPATILFVGASFALKTADNAAMLPPPALYAVSIVPVGIMLSMFWAHWRYMTEIDEFLRFIQVKGAFTGLIIVMTIASGWGWLEFYADAPRLSIFWLNPIYWIAYSVAVLWFTPRDRAAT
ncbi:hypothetical protein [Pelagibacterium limicola]|uniref:hypothetical protein n=1 Tax=Pelagibacterium limicola TaxID=2791022 RepID=UPI0018AFCF7A|nr:hypothetical protein [Pelagibacterium limicola]